MKRIGSTFHAELDAANVRVDCKWTEDGIYFGPCVTEAEKAQVLAILEAHDPDKVDPQREIERIEREAPPIPRRVWRDMIAGGVRLGLISPDAPIVAVAAAEEAQIASLRPRR